MFYTIQIYFDFSGYSDMAIGLGRIFGFHFRENFNDPYVSTSITEFWRRWHISLSSWFRDYLYIPLGGNRSGNVYFHLIVVFLCTGLWHGANWTFVLWGIWHGLFILIERIEKNKSVHLPIPKALRWLLTMLIVVFGWVLFRCESLAQTVAYISAMLSRHPQGFQWYNIRYYLDWQIAATFIVAVIISSGIPKKLLKRLKDPDRPLLLCAKSVALVVILLYSLSMIVNGNYSPFIYFRF